MRDYAGAVSSMPREGRYQFSVRALIIFLTLLSFLLAQIYVELEYNRQCRVREGNDMFRTLTNQLDPRLSDVARQSETLRIAAYVEEQFPGWSPPVDK